MGVDLTVQVINISPKATKEDLVTLFSYCGTVHDIKLEWDVDRTQTAKVTIRQPYAFETSLLLNNAILIDRRIRILPLEMKEIPISSFQSEDQSTQGNGSEGDISISPFNGLLHTGLREEEIIAKAKDFVLNTRMVLTQQAGPAIASAQRIANEFDSNILQSECVSKGVVWLSGVLDKASKHLSELSNKAKGLG